jgi:hypothetical protein
LGKLTLTHTSFLSGVNLEKKEGRKVRFLRGRWFYPLFLLLAFWLVFIFGPVPAGGSNPPGEEMTVHFYAEDPEGDDYGPGSYIYPNDPAFAPYEGLFDLLAFRVWSDRQGEEVYFDVKIKNVTNPWVAPEGFIHPVIHIYIVTGKGTNGEPVNDGPRVVFSPRHRWEFALTGVGWENSTIYYPAVDGGLQETAITAAYLQVEDLIRLAAPKKIIGTPKANWRYYVFTGSYDGFGPGFFREVKEEADEWFFGGGAGGENTPRVLDLLAPAGGKYPQEKQLQVFPGGQRACLHPVGAGRTGGFWWLWLFILPAGVVLWFLCRKRPVLSIFWYRKKRN